MALKPSSNLYVLSNIAGILDTWRMFVFKLFFSAAVDNVLIHLTGDNANHSWCIFSVGEIYYLRYLATCKESVNAPWLWNTPFDCFIKTFIMEILSQDVCRVLLLFFFFYWSLTIRGRNALVTPSVVVAIPSAIAAGSGRT